MTYRQKANQVLTIVFLIFILATWLKHLYPTNLGIRFFLFVSEAALVGGIADWFAVTALFRKPLGWPYHTALIPCNRDKMIAGITAMVQDELLSEALLRKKIEGFPFTQWLIQKVEQKGGTRLIAEKLTQILKTNSHKISSSNVATELEQIFRDQLVEKGISKPFLAKVRSFLGMQEFEFWIDERIEEGLELASQPRVRERLLESLGQIQQEQVGNGGMLQKTLLGFFQVTDSINLDEAAEALQIELILHLRELKQHQHPVRERLKEVLSQQLLAWERNPSMLNTLEGWKNTQVLELEVKAILTPVLEQVINSLREGQLPSGRPVADFLEHSLKLWWEEFKESHEHQASLDKLFQDFLLQALQSEHAIIGQVVRDTLEGFDDKELNRFIEEKAGEDLQWIRINGSLVGGFVGAVLFVILNYGYAPLLGLVQ